MAHPPSPKQGVVRVKHAPIGVKRPKAGLELERLLAHEAILVKRSKFGVTNFKRFRKIPRLGGPPVGVAGVSQPRIAARHRPGNDALFERATSGFFAKLARPDSVPQGVFVTTMYTYTVRTVPPLLQPLPRTHTPRINHPHPVLIFFRYFSDELLRIDLTGSFQGTTTGMPLRAALCSM